ncbi:MAG: lipid II:glycine glycyltransferase FemX [Limisphaerales bacterium]
MSKPVAGAMEWPLPVDVVKPSSACEWFSPLGVSDWDTRLENFAGANVFHTAAWSRVIQQAYGFEPVFLRESVGEGQETILPLAEVRSWLRGSRGVCLPFADFCAPLSRDYGKEASVLSTDLWEAVVDRGRERGWKYVEIRGEPGSILPDEAPVPSLHVLEHRIDLTLPPEQLQANLHPGMRRNIRKAESSGLQVEISTQREAVREYYELHCLTRRNKHGLPPQPLRLFEAIATELIERKAGFVVLVRDAKSQEPLAGAVFLRWKDQAIYKYGASDDRHLARRPNNLVLWKGILQCKALGCSQLSLGRTDLGHEGLRRFKTGLGAAEQQVKFYRYDLKAERWGTERSLHEGWHNGLFRRLPLWANRLAGEILYPHLD